MVGFHSSHGLGVHAGNIYICVRPSPNNCANVSHDARVSIMTALLRFFLWNASAFFRSKAALSSFESALRFRLRSDSICLRRPGYFSCCLVGPWSLSNNSFVCYAHGWQSDSQAMATERETMSTCTQRIVRSCGRGRGMYFVSVCKRCTTCILSLSWD